jgi:plastocyanin
MNENEEKNEVVKKSPGGMNWTLIIVALLIILTGGYYFMTASKTQKPSYNNSEAAEPTTSALQEGSNTEENLENTNGTQEAATGTTNAVTPALNDKGVQTISVEGGMYYFKPNKIIVKKNTPVKITFTSVGGMHDFVLDVFNVKSDLIGAGKSTTVEFTPDKTGEFQYYCSVANHRAMGMVGTLVVE